MQVTQSKWGLNLIWIDVMIHFWWQAYQSIRFILTVHDTSKESPKTAFCYSSLSRRWGVHATGCRPIGCWDPRRRGCGHLRQRPDGSPIPWGERAELRGTRHGLRRLLGALYELPSSPPHPRLEWVRERTLEPPARPARLPLFTQMTPKHALSLTQKHHMHAAIPTLNALHTHRAHVHTLTVCKHAGESERRDKQYCMCWQEHCHIHPDHTVYIHECVTQNAGLNMHVLTIHSYSN